jgi:hypothetical protein
LLKAKKLVLQIKKIIMCHIKHSCFGSNLEKKLGGKKKLIWKKKIGGKKKNLRPISGFL